MAGSFGLLKCAIILLIAHNDMINYCVHAKTDSVIAKIFKEHEVVPDVVRKAPNSLVRVQYHSGVSANLGNVLTPIQTKDEPTVMWHADSNQYYTLAMVDPDGTETEVKHWLVVNVPGDNVARGEVLADYIGPAPPLGTGLHRYVFLIYRQPCLLTFDEPRLTNSSTNNRTGFSIARFAKKYSLGDPKAGNFFRAEYYDDVQKLSQ